eukprot:g6503.t1
MSAQLRTPRRSVSFSAASVRTTTNPATRSGDALLLPFEGAPASHPNKEKDTKGRTLTDAVVDAVWELLAEKSATFRTPAADDDQRILLQHYAVRHYPEFLASSILKPDLAARLRSKPLTKRALKDFLDHLCDTLVLQTDVLLNVWVLLERFLVRQKERKDQKNKMCLGFTRYSWPLVVMAALMCAVPAYEDNGPSLYEYAVAVKEWAGFVEFYGLRLVHANTFLPAVGCGGGALRLQSDSCFPFPSCLQPSFALAVVFNKLLPQKLFSRKNLMRAQLQFLDAIGWRAFVRPEDWLDRYEGLLQRVELPDEDKKAEEAAEVAAELRRKRLQLMFENGAGQEGADGPAREGVLLNGRSSSRLASAAAAAGDYANNRKSNRSQIFRTADDCAISSPTCDWDNDSIVSSEAKTPERTSFLRRCSPADDDDGAIRSPERARNSRASFVFQPAGRVSSDMHSSARRAPFNSAMRRCSAKLDSAARAPSHDKLLLFTSSDENNAPPPHMIPPRKRSSKESIALSTHPRLSATQTARPSDQVPSLFAFNKMRRCRSDQIAASWAAADHGHQLYDHDGGESSHPLMRARHRDWSQRSLVSLWREKASMPMFVGEADEEPEGALTKTRFRQIRESFDDLNRALGKEAGRRTSSKNGGGGAGQGVGWLQGRGSVQSGSSQKQGGRISNDNAMFDVEGQVPADAGENAVETTAAAGSGSGLLSRSTLTRSSTSKPIATNKGCLAAKESLSTTASRLTRTTVSYYGRNTAGTVSFRQSVLDRAARESCCVASGGGYLAGR